GQKFVREYRKAFGKQPNPYAAYGYTAMAMVLDAIQRAGKKADQRKEVTSAMVATKDFDSPVGRFSIDPNGDTTLDAIAGYTIAAKKPKFAAALKGTKAPLKPQQ